MFLPSLYPDATCLCQRLTAPPVRRYYSPGYSEHLLERLETYEPDWTDGAREDWQQDAPAASGITA